MDIETQTKLLKIKGFLNEANHITYTFSEVNRSHPMGTVNQDIALKLIVAYESLMEDLTDLVTSYEQSKTDDTTA